MATERKGVKLLSLIEDKMKSFVLYQEYKKHLSLLSTEQKGKLLEAIFEYNDGIEINLDPITTMAFSFIKSDLDINKNKWEETCKKRREAGRAGGLRSGEVRKKEGEANEANASTTKQKEANEANNKNESDNESEYKNKNDNKRSSKKSYDDFQLQIANQLGKFLKQQLNKNITQSQIESWANDIRLLMERDISNRSNVKDDVVKAMQAVLDKSGQPFFPVVESGDSFRKKFTNIERNCKTIEAVKQLSSNELASKQFLEGNY